MEAENEDKVVSSNLLTMMIFCILCVSMTLRIGQYTAVFMGHDSSHCTGVAVCAGRGMVCQKPTLGISVENPGGVCEVVVGALTLWIAMATSVSATQLGLT